MHMVFINAFRVISQYTLHEVINSLTKNLCDPYHHHLPRDFVLRLIEFESPLLSLRIKHFPSCITQLLLHTFFELLMLMVRVMYMMRLVLSMVVG